MHYKYFFIIIFFYILPSLVKAEMTVEKLIFDDQSPFHLKMLEVLPKEAIIQIGPDNSENTIIEFMDYFCGYCKKIHYELIDLVDERNDVRVIFLQYPIMNETSLLISKMVLAANLQDKGFDLHNAIFSVEGSLTQDKLQRAIKDSGVNENKLRIDLGKDKIDKMIHLSSFLAGGSGPRGTPALFINEKFYPGYMTKDQILSLF